MLVSSDTTVFPLLENWSPKKAPDELGFVDGERPRAWKGCCGTSSTVDNALNLIDGNGATYNPVTSNSINNEYYTIDLGVPVPLFRFAMSTPDKGFFRSDGTPLEEDSIPAFEVSIAPDTNDDVLNTSNPIGEVIVEARENVVPKIAAEFPLQYVRYVRYKRKNSILDEATNQSLGHSGTARKGTVAEFFLWGEGIPKRATYKTVIFDLGTVVNFGRLFWKATPMRLVDGVAEEAPDANVQIEVEARTGIDSNPDIYYEFTDMGTRVVVEQARYQGKLKNQSAAVTNADGLGGTDPHRGPKQGSAPALSTTNKTDGSGPFNDRVRPALNSTGGRICRSRWCCTASDSTSSCASIPCGLRPRRYWLAASWLR